MWLLPSAVPQVATDAHRVYTKVLDHYQGKLVQHVVYYGDIPDEQAFYGSLAQRTGGMLMQPTRSNAGHQVLSSVLLYIVKTLLGRLQPVWPPPPAAGDEAEDGLEALEDFVLYHLAELRAVEDEEVRPGHCLFACWVGQGQFAWWDSLLAGVGLGGD
jgi:hypothetical protein